MKQGLTDANLYGLTIAGGLGSRTELFASWGIVGVDRDMRPYFVPSDTNYGGVAQDYPYVRRGWAGNLGTPLLVGGKVNFISQSRGDAMALALRITGSFPIGPAWGGTNAMVGRADLIASREFGKQFELTGTTGRRVARGSGRIQSVRRHPLGRRGPIPLAVAVQRARGVAGGMELQPVPESPHPAVRRRGRIGRPGRQLHRRPVAFQCRRGVPGEERVLYSLRSQLHPGAWAIAWSGAPASTIAAWAGISAWAGTRV